LESLALVVKKEKEKETLVLDPNDGLDMYTKGN